MNYKATAVLLTLALGGCVSTSNVLEVGKDTYSVSATADGFRDAASARQSAFNTGAEHCKNQNGYRHNGNHLLPLLK